MSTDVVVSKKKSRRGFASMNPELQREIASRGGSAAHAKGTAHKWTPQEASLAGQKGGKAISANRDHMAEIGTRGGKNSRRGRKGKE